MSIKDIRHKVIPKKLEPIIDEAYRKSRVRITALRYNRPARNLRVIAITGTNGKTSTCNFLNDLLKHAGYRTALFTTAVIEMNGVHTINTTHRTVPLTTDLMKFLKSARDSKVDWVILETTSHALDQHKMHGIPVEIAVMTNLTQDHLDYHGSMELYAKAKARLFNSYMNPKVCILNADDEWYEYFSKQCIGQQIAYGTGKQADIRISSLTSTIDGVKMRLDTEAGSIVATSPVIGAFNGYNLTAAVAVALQIGIAPDVIRNGLRQITPVPGRMEMITSPKGFTVVVDYAHTPDALEKALSALRETKARRVVVLFGATGDRDTTKRPIMGAIAAKFADQIYLTDDETYTENGDAIRQAVMEGIIKEGGKNRTVEIADREEAIRQAVQNARAGDMILVAGLGHQDYRAMNEGHIPWQESAVVRSILTDSATVKQ